MNNIHYIIKEKHDDDNDVKKDIKDIEIKKIENKVIECLQSKMNRIEYMTTTENSFLGFDDGIVNNFLFDLNEHLSDYSVKQLKHIAAYYKLKCNNKRKSDIIDIICEYEENRDNFDIVCKRKRLWQNIVELINDEYLGEFIHFT